MRRIHPGPVAALLALLLAPACSLLTSAGTAPAVAEGGGDVIVNLYDAFGEAREGLRQDFGFSALIRYRGQTILFDSGTDADVLKANAEVLGVDLADVDFAVASHAHFDHVNGFDHLLEVNPDVPVYFPADPFWGADLPFDVSGAEPGIAETLPDEQRYFHGATERFVFQQSGRYWKANVKFVAETTEIAPGITLVATRSPYMGYFSRHPSLGGVGGTEGAAHGHGDVKTIGLPELSLNLETPDGDVLVVGCSHSLVETIVRTTREHLGRSIGLIYGGYHLLPYTAPEIREMAVRMRDEHGVAAVAPAHCTGHAGFAVFREVFAGRYHVAGLGSTTPFPGPRPAT